MIMNRKIPVTMATQHPDNALPAFWNNKQFISTYDEIEECYRMFNELAVQEYMWDWEGKFVDESVIDKLYRKYYDFFKKNQLGRDIFLTFRIPNIWCEQGYRLARAFMSILTADDFAHDLKLHSPPVFEVILPMTTTHKQLMHVQNLFRKIARYKSEVFGSHRKKLQGINVIPLFEGVETMIDAPQILKKYCGEMKKEYNEVPEYMRVFIARSDPAMNSGLVPAVISAKAAISNLKKFENESGIRIYPWLGAGSLPFRGGVNPENYKNIVQEYRGLSSITIQSAFRYDYPLPEVKRAINYLNRNLGQKNQVCLFLKPAEIKKIKQINSIFQKYFQYTIENTADKINFIAKNIPSRRERMLHIGLLGYSRGVGKVQLPRAIQFTAALYSLGIPPELIGTGRGLKELEQRGELDFFKYLYQFFREDIVHAGHYLNRENLELLCRENGAWLDVKKDIEYIEEYLKEELGPQTTHHFIHRNLVSTIHFRSLINEDFTDELNKAAIIRKSLG
jgi:phosphoenolpyruvate carboxylase